MCYETDAEDGLTDIFIDDIHPEGLAALDGRLRLGDQIIQINGIDVKTKAQAQDIFLGSTGDISFLVARPPGQYGGCNGLDEDIDDLDFQEEEEAAPLSCDIAPHEQEEEVTKSNRNSFGTNGSEADSLLLEKKQPLHDYSFTSQSSNGSSSTAHSGSR